MNNIKSLLDKQHKKDRFFTIEYKPTPELLKLLSVKMNGANRILKNKKDPNFHDAKVLSEVIGCNITEIFPEAEMKSIYKQTKITL